MLDYDKRLFFVCFFLSSKSFHSSYGSIINWMVLSQSQDHLIIWITMEISSSL